MSIPVSDKRSLQDLKDVDIRTVDREELIDLNTIHIDSNLPVCERVDAFLRQIKNPYCFRVGNVAVKVIYQDNGPSFQQNFEEMLLSM